MAFAGIVFLVWEGKWADDPESGCVFDTGCLLLLAGIGLFVWEGDGPTISNQGCTIPIGRAKRPSRGYAQTNENFDKTLIKPAIKH